MKPFQLYLMKSIRTILQYNLFSMRQSISLVSCCDRQVPYLKVSGITKYTLRFIYERSKPSRKGRLIQPRQRGRLLCFQHYIFICKGLKQATTKTSEKPYSNEIRGTRLGGTRVMLPIATFGCFPILSLSKTNRLRHLSVWCFSILITVINFSFPCGLHNGKNSYIVG
jgi:hypothetical protein